MNKNIKLAVAGSVLALSASANAGIIIPAGDWTLDISGNVNSFVTNTRTSGAATILGAHSALTAGPNAGGEKNASNITTGLLPNFLSVGGTTRQNDLDVSFLIQLTLVRLQQQVAVNLLNKKIVKLISPLVTSHGVLSRLVKTSAYSQVLRS